jgi:hypothetical protein
MEDVRRKNDAPKVYGETAIPAGRYEVVVDFSPHFQRQIPRILNVPNFEGILLHGGNRTSDSYGCVLIAYNRLSNSWIYGSAERDLTKLLSKAGESFIEIIDTFPYVGV